MCPRNESDLVRPWSQGFLINYDKTLIKKHFGDTPKKSDKKEKKKKKTKMVIAKLFALNANAKRCEIC